MSSDDARTRRLVEDKKGFKPWAKIARLKRRAPGSTLGARYLATRTSFRVRSCCHRSIQLCSRTSSLRSNRLCSRLIWSSKTLSQRLGLSLQVARWQRRSSCPCSTRSLCRQHCPCCTSHLCSRTSCPSSICPFSRCSNFVRSTPSCRRNERISGSGQAPRERTTKRVREI